MKRIYPAVTLFLAFASFLLPAIGRAQENLFPGRTYTTGTQPYSVAVGDFNGDGKSDLAVANYSSATVSVLLNKGDGTFAAKVDYKTGNSPQSVAVGDFNGDGKPDLVVANSSSSTVSVLLNNGDGTFAAKVDYPTSGAAYSVAVGDFNGDGKLDIAVGTGGSVNVFLGKGDGTFAAKVSYATGTNSYSVAVGDFNGDNIPDLAVANAGSNNVSILLGKGDGTFAARISYATGLSPRSVAVGDFNGDGKPDIVTANSGVNPSQNTVSVLLNNGDGTFAAKVDYPTGYSPYAVTVGDFNGDGKPDIVSANFGTPGIGMAYVGSSVSVLLNTGNGTFAPKTDYTTGADPVSVAVGDFNGDGKLDLVTANAGVASPNYGSTITILSGNGNGTFAASEDLAAGAYPISVAAGDFNGDGKPDIVTANSNSNNVSVLLGKGDGTFAAKVDYALGASPNFVAVGDFNGDGRPDIVVAYFSNRVGVLLNNGNGTFAAVVNYSTGSTTTGSTFYYYLVAVGDFNGDGKLDIAVTNYNANSVSVLLGNGDGTFAAGVNYTTGSNPYSVAVADFNGDGKLDLVTANNGAGTVSVLLGNGDGTFAAKVDYTITGNPHSVAVGDINGDGIPDIVAVTGSGSIIGGLVNVLPGKGDGTFGANVRYLITNAVDPACVAVGDFDGDGRDDIAVVSYGAGPMTVLLTNVNGVFANGTFATRQDYAVGPAPNSVAVADFNGDGKLDIVTANTASTVGVLLNVAVRSRVSGLLTLEGISPAAPAQPVTFTFRTPGFPDFAPTLNVPPSGNFALNLPKRSGTLHIKGSKYLAANVSVDATAGDVSGLAALLGAGDANNDNSVDSSDFGVLIGAFNTDSRIPGSGYDETADLNGDGFVDSSDFGLLVGEFNNTGDL